MQMATGGPPSTADAGDSLARAYRLAGTHGTGFQVVVRSDQPVAVVQHHPVPAAPEVPAGGPDHAGIGRVHRSAAGGRVVLAQMEVSGQATDRAVPWAERRRRQQNLQRGHEVAHGWPGGAGREQLYVPHRQSAGGHRRAGETHCGAWKVHHRAVVRGRRSGQHARPPETGCLPVFAHHAGGVRRHWRQARLAAGWQQPRAQGDGKRAGRGAGGGRQARGNPGPLPALTPVASPYLAQ